MQRDNQDLLPAVVRAFLNPCETEQLVESFVDFREWDDLLARAAAHRVSPVLWKVFSNLPEGTAPAAVLSRLRAEYERIALFNLKKLGEMRRLYELFERNDIQAVPLKGPVLAVAAYGDLAMRRFDDLDFLFAKESILRARDLLAAEGYQLTHNLHWPCEPAAFRYNKGEFSMYRDQSSIDLHWRLLPLSEPYQVDSEALWNDLSEITIAGRQMRTLSPEHHLLYLAAHGTKHLWSRLGWICDFARCVQVFELDWPRLIGLADSKANRQMLAHSLTVARDFTGIVLPRDAERLIERCPGLSKASERLAPGIADRISRPDAPTCSYLEHYRYLREFFDGPLDGPRTLHGKVLAPTAADWDVVHLPPAAYALYYPFRLARLAVKYTLGRKD